MATKKTSKPPVIKRVEDMRELRTRLRPFVERIQAIQTNAGGSISEAMGERLLGAEHALQEVARKANYLGHWLNLAETKIRSHHEDARKDCRCAVCTRVRIGFVPKEKK